MTDTQQRAAAKAFAKNWKDRGYEKGDSQIFWVELLTTVFGVTEISKFISFEDQVHLDHTSFIDGYIEKTHVMIEQKSINKSLTAAIRQSDGSMLTPFEQAKRYSSELPYSKRPRWIVTSNFQSFYIYDMEKPGGDPEIIQLEDLEKEYYRLQFLVDEGNTNLQREMEVSIAAGEIVGLLYDALAKQYVDPTTERAMKSLNILCVRMVFCLYAEDAGIFGQHGMFHDYLEEFDTRHMRKAVIELFQVLDTKPEDRDPYIEESLAQFPYVNGGLFANEDIEIPQFTDEIRNLLLEKASADFDWSEISPTIFGAVFESTLNPETRRSGGMHYTSIENIHKVIDPLFLDDLKNELKEIQQITVQRTEDKKLRDSQTKLSNLRWLDPASGSGNFLTETYISIRRLENEVIKELQRGQITFGFDESSPIHVSIDQFYGIEINDFAVTVAKTALWIAESQMMKETEDIVHMNLDFLPLTTNAFIVEGNSLQIDWERVVPKYQVSYIMGNPPFHGFTFMTAEQKQDMQNIFPGVKNLDFVCAWYKKASDYIRGTKIEVAFVSTNSIVQGETVSRFWDFMQDDIIGVFDAGIFAIGETICSPKKKFEFESIPTFAPEHFMRVRQKDTLKRKQFVKGTTQIAQEGAIQIFHEPDSGMEEVIVGVVGVLQLEVFEYRMKNEYNVDLFKEGLPYSYIRWIDNKDIDPKTLKLSSDTKLVKDFRDNYLLLFTSEWNIRWALERNEGLELSEFNRGDLQ